MALADSKRIINLPLIEIFDGDMYLPIYHANTDTTYRMRVDLLTGDSATSFFTWDAFTEYDEDNIVSYSQGLGEPPELWISTANGNTGNAPGVGSAFWTPGNRSKSGLVPWEAGIFVEDFPSVYFDDGGGTKLYRLIDPVRPYNSVDIETEIIAGDWELVAGGGEFVPLFFPAAINVDGDGNPITWDNVEGFYITADDGLSQSTYSFEASNLQLTTNTPTGSGSSVEVGALGFGGLHGGFFTASGSDNPGAVSFASINASGPGSSGSEFIADYDDATGLSSSLINADLIRAEVVSPLSQINFLQLDGDFAEIRTEDPIGGTHSKSRLSPFEGRLQYQDTGGTQTYFSAQQSGLAMTWFNSSGAFVNITGNSSGMTFDYQDAAGSSADMVFDINNLRFQLDDQVNELYHQFEMDGGENILEGTVADDNTITNTLLLRRKVYGDLPGANGIGQRIWFVVANDTGGTPTDPGELNYIMDDVTDGSEDTRFLFKSVTAGALIDAMEIRGAGVVVPNSSRGLILQSPDNDYWLLQVDNAGAAAWTNLGPTL